MDILIGIPLRNNKSLPSSSLFRLYVVCHIMQNLYILCYVHQSVMGSGLVSLAFHWNLAVRTAHLEPRFTWCRVYLKRKWMKRTAARNSMDKQQPTWVMIVSLFRSELEMVSLRGVWREEKRESLCLQVANQVSASFVYRDVIGWHVVAANK